MRRTATDTRLCPKGQRPTISGAPVRVAVCVSAVPAAAYGDRSDWGPWVLSPASAAAVDAAVRLKQHPPNTWLTALSVGPDDADAILRECLIRGADEAVRVWEQPLETGDVALVAGALARAVRELDACLVLCGSGETPNRIAALLRAPLLSNARSLRLSVDAATAEGRTPAGAEPSRAVRIALPAVVAVTASSRRRQRALSLSDRFRAGRIEIRRMRLQVG